MKKSWLCFISVFIFPLFSCNKTGEEIKIHWELLCDISNINFVKTPIELEFSNFHRSKVYKLIPNRTESIKLEEDMRLIGQGWPGGGLMIYIYPDIHANGIGSKDEDRFRKHNAMEIFLYNPSPIKEDEGSVTMRPHKKIIAYQYYLYDDIVYIILSQDNCINKNIDEITEISVPERTPLAEILDFMHENNLSECFYVPEIAPYSDNMDVYGGLIVNSRLSDKEIILIPPYGN